MCVCVKNLKNSSLLNNNDTCIRRESVWCALIRELCRSSSFSSFLLLPRRS